MSTADEIVFAAERRNLHDLLRVAMKVEMTTIPAYLQALFSIEDVDDGGANREAREAIRSVVVEEMLHLTLVANILNATGGATRLGEPSWAPRYPCPLFPRDALGCSAQDPETGARRTILGRHALTVRLRPFSIEQVGLFEDIEAQHPPKSGVFAVEIQSIGQFYGLLEAELARMVERYGPARVFTGDPARQVGADYYYAAGGALLTIGPGAAESLDQARAAIRTITDEGEGLHHGRDIFDGDAVPGVPAQDIAHVFKFREILAGRRYGAGQSWRDPPAGAPMATDWSAVWPAVDDPDPDDPALPPDVAEAMRAFDRRYSALIRQIDRGFSGEPEALRAAVAGMFELKYMGVALMRTPLGNGRTAAPAWRYVCDAP